MASAISDQTAVFNINKKYGVSSVQAWQLWLIRRSLWWNSGGPRPYLKRAVMLVTWPIWDGPIAKDALSDMSYLCAKFHSFIIKGTIIPPICYKHLWTKTNRPATERLQYVWNESFNMMWYICVNLIYLCTMVSSTWLLARDHFLLLLVNQLHVLSFCD